ncbi:HD domain-containing protein [Acidobacterium sp. S8]|uniref:HD domain-containing protein n=1 Tax=Acidobacterium sp. S8 TaxID=1641854 RepID=UPI00131CD866|nr:HD domain-containing protein [Acidobacterium sp. S8]
MSELIKAAKMFANSGHQRIAVERNPALQSHEAHLKSVAQIVSSASGDEQMIAAAWLHDIVEDTGVTIDDVERQFGVQVAKLVYEVTVVSDPARGHRAASFALSKQHFAKVSDAAKTVKLADLIDTSRDLYKNDWAMFRTYAAEANELALVLNGGNTRLLTRLKRDLNKYASSTQPARSSPQMPQSRRFEIPIATLRVLEDSFTAQDITQPLITFDSNRTATEILEAMTVAGIEVAGLQRDGTQWGFVEIASLSKGVGKSWGREFAASQLLYTTSTFTDVIEVLTRHDWCFVTELGNVIGAISRIDIQKPVGRM